MLKKVPFLSSSHKNVSTWTAIGTMIVLPISQEAHWTCKDGEDYCKHSPKQVTRGRLQSEFKQPSSKQQDEIPGPWTTILALGRISGDLEITDKHSLNGHEDQFTLITVTICKEKGHNKQGRPYKNKKVTYIYFNLLII